MKTVAIINLKGGVAKTTTAVSLAELLAEGDKRRKRPGSRVLLFDNDKQGNASRIFGAYEREQEEGREMPDGVESQTGYCRFCGQAGMVHTLTGWSQEDVDEAVTCKCECDAAKKYAESKERVQKAKSRITELFGNTAERPIDQDVVTVMLNVVDAIEAKHMKGITIDVGQGVKAKVSKMAKESIKVERSETSKKIYEE